VIMLLTSLIPRNMISGEIRVLLGLPTLDLKVASWESELADALGRQCTRHLGLAVSPPLRPLLCGDWLWHPTTIGKRFVWR
jgi:hypothetical protein